MYELEGDASDYAVEQIPGFELTDENVLVLQDRDFETSSLEEVVEVLENMSNDLVRLAEHHRTLTIAKESIDQIRTRSKLNLAISFRESMEKKYGIKASPVNVAESFHMQSSMVLALEEETEQEKGFFMRMIDAIGKAFKWLWDKIAGLFKSGPKDGKITEDDAKSLKEAEVSGAQAEDEFITSEGTLKNFKGFGDVVKYDDIISSVENLDNHLETLKEIIRVAADEFRLANSVSNNSESKVDDFKKTLANNAAAFGAQVSKLPRRPAAEAEEVKKKVKAGFTVIDDSIHGLSRIGPSDCFFWKMKTGDTEIWSGASVILVSSKPPSKIEYATSVQLLSKNQKLEKAVEHYNKLKDVIAEFTEAAGSDASIKKFKEKMSAIAKGSDDAEMKRVASAIQLNVEQMKTAAMAASGATRGISSYYTAVQNYTDLCLKRKFKKPSGEKEEKKEEK